MTRSPYKRKTPSRRKASSRSRRLAGGNKLLPVSTLPRNCNQGIDCIEYKGGYFSVANADGAEDGCKVVKTLDGLESGIYTYVLFANGSTS